MNQEDCVSSCCKESVEKIEIQKDHLITDFNEKFFYVCSNCGQEVKG